MDIVVFKFAIDLNVLSLSIYIYVYTFICLDFQLLETYRKCIQEVDVKEKKVHLDLVVEKFRVEEQQ